MKKLFVLLNLLLSVSLLFAQNTILVKGKVTDSKNESVPGASILVKGTMQGTITDVDGLFTIQANPQATLVISFVGMQTQEIPVNNKATINVQMKEESFNVDEVVVVGYGTQKVKDLTSSISTVKSDDLVKTPAGQAMQSLQGKVAGMQVVSNGGPGNSPTIRVRGVGSYPTNSDGTMNNNDAPLYVVDGMFFDNIDFLNPTDIASISVLKDASAAAIYGVRAANGVVLIETKSGSINQKSEITYDGYYGTQVAQNVLKMANAEQFTTMAMESGSAADASFILNAMQRYGRSRINPNVPDVNTDWYKEIMRPAQIQNHSLGVSGGNQKTTYSLGANYFDQEGILDMKNEYQRFNLRSKIDFRVNKWLTIGGNAIFSNALKYGEEAEAWDLAYFAVPILPVYDDQNVNAWPDKFANAKDIGYRNGQNPMPSLKYNSNRLKVRKMLTNFYLKVDILPKKLNFKTTYNHAFTSLDERNITLPYDMGQNVQQKLGVIERSMSNYSDQIWDNILTFTDKYRKHGLTAMVGTSFRDEAYNKLGASGEDFPTEYEQSWYIDQAHTKLADKIKDEGTRQYGFSYFGRLSYNYDDRYLLYATMRADGTSKYQDKWSYFPAFGGGWVMSEEKFLKGNPILNFLKLRFGWGQLGNDKIKASDGAYTNSVIFTAINGTKVSGVTTANSFSWLKWEVTEESNIGLTSRLLKNRLALDLDYYIRDTKDAAINVPVPFVGGTVLRNKGIIRNSGLEASLNWSDELSNGIKYTVGANIATLKNKVRELGGLNYLDGGSAEFRQRSIVGQPLLAFYGYEVEGVYQNQAEIDADSFAKANGLVPGDLKYKDQQKQGEAGYGVINDDDRVILGSYFPNLTYGFNFSIAYKNLELSANMVGQSGNKILNRKRGQYIWTADGNMDADLAKNRWHGEGTSNKYTSSSGLRRGWNQKMSDFFVEDGSFFRVQNVQLAYNLKKQQVFGFALPETRISLTADRPLTFFKYNGFSPEVANGVDTQTYPIPAVYTLGLNIKF